MYDDTLQMMDEQHVKIEGIYHNLKKICMSGSSEEILSLIIEFRDALVEHLIFENDIIYNLNDEYPSAQSHFEEHDYINRKINELLLKLETDFDKIILVELLLDIDYHICRHQILADYDLVRVYKRINLK